MTQNRKADRECEADSEGMAILVFVLYIWALPTIQKAVKCTHFRDGIRIHMYLWAACHHQTEYKLSACVI